MSKNTLYIIQNHTSMHVGSGDANFGTVDRLIQRDPVTGYPTIHSSSLKGALREYCDARHDAQESETFIDQVFGSEDRAGTARFLDAFLLAVPMRSETRPYYACTSPKALAQLVDMAAYMGVKLPGLAALRQAAGYNKAHIAISEGEARIESFDAKAEAGIDFQAIERYTGGPAAIVPDETFAELLKDLPVIARNQLENGESKNLWYEEVLPRQSRLFTFVSTPTHIHADDGVLHKHHERLHRYLTDGEEAIQIGANASIGYGLCSFEEVKGE